MKPTTRRRLRWIFGVLAIAIGAYAIAIVAGLEDEGVVENQVVIHRTPEVVFDYASDMRHELDWNPDVESMQKITDGPVGLGTRFAAKWKQSEPVVVEITRFDRPKAWTGVNGGSLEATVAATFVPHAEGTLFTSRFTARPHGFLKIIFPIFKRMMAKFEKANMGYLKHAIETRT